MRLKEIRKLKEAHKYQDISNQALPGNAEIIYTAEKTIFTTPLHLAIIKNDEEWFLMLLESSDYFDTLDIFNRTPMYLALLLGRNQHVAMLIDYTRNIDEERGVNFESMALDPNIDIANISMEYVVILGASRLLAYLIANGRAADVNSLNNHGTPMLHLAAQHRNADVVWQLLQAGAQVNARDSENNTALHRAILSGASNIAYPLLQANIDVNAINSDNNTALHLAIAQRNEEVMLLLVGFDHTLYRQHLALNIINNRGQSPLHLAILTHNTDAIDILLRYGADIHLTNNNFEHVPSPHQYFIALYGHDPHMMNYWRGLTDPTTTPPLLHTALPPLQINTSSIDEEDPSQMPPFLGMGMMNSFFS